MAKRKARRKPRAKVKQPTHVRIKEIKSLYERDWRVAELEDYEGYFIVENGDAYSTRGRWGHKQPVKKLKHSEQNGYPSIGVYKTGNRGSSSGDVVYIHRLLGTAFIDNPEKKCCINHIDGDKTNLKLENLEWSTKAENNLHDFENGLMTQMKYGKEDALSILNLHHKEGKTRSEVVTETGLPLHYVNDVINGKAGKSLGLGDDIENLLNSKLVKPIKDKVVSLIWGENNEDCGCEKRKEKLNKLFPKNKPKCFTKEQFEDWIEASKEIKETNQITAEQQTKIIFYLREILNMSVAASCKSCSSSIWRKYIDMLDKVADTYEQQ